MYDFDPEKMKQGLSVYNGTQTNTPSVDQISAGMQPAPVQTFQPPAMQPAPTQTLQPLPAAEIATSKADMAEGMQTVANLNNQEMAATIDSDAKKAAAAKEDDGFPRPLSAEELQGAIRRWQTPYST